jgi:hypothetical protein
LRGEQLRFDDPANQLKGNETQTELGVAIAPLEKWQTQHKTVEIVI